MNEPAKLAGVMGSSLNASIAALEGAKKGGKGPKANGKKSKVPRAIRELRDRDGLDPRDLLGL